ncbi:FUSC family protein [Acidiphilium sp. PA]|uniref:FUSC family protein n=1 Tax=Acidiphilium sp. PA TaxID=2871705 RepID=UPI002242DD2B|nr:FUSC family protein [Acidiphilium sp. PA]MCW8306439.1 FUSC family protein [Acidiphilium sp. PA]
MGQGSAAIAAADRAGLPALGGLSLNFRAVSLLEGVRAAIAVAGTMAVGSLLGLPQLGLAALGALLACFADPGGPVRARLPPMLVFGVLGALCFSIFGLILARSPAFAILAAGVTIFACSFARIYGQSGLQTGNLVSVATVLSLDAPIRSVMAAIPPGLAFWAGAAGAALLTLALWRIRPFHPVRMALADLALALSALARDLVDLANEPRPDEDGFDLHARGHRRAVREAIERAREVMLATIRRRGAASRRANAIALRLATFDQMFGAMIAVGEAMAADPAGAPASRQALRDLAPLLAALAPAIEADRSLDTAPIREALRRLRDDIGAISEEAPIRRLLDAVADRLSVVVTVSNAPGPSPVADGTAIDWRGMIFGPIRANWTLESVPLRHALRTAIVTTPVLGFVQWLGNPFGHWLAITVIFVLQPHFSATWVRALERVGGTAAGGVLAALIGLVCHTRLELALAMIPLALVAFAIRGVNFSAYTAVLTPMIVLLIEQISPGVNQWTVALSRVGFTLGGGVLAVAANLVLWPSFEGNRLGAARDAAIAAHRDYLAASFAYLLDGGPLPEAARRQAGLASNNLEASVSRALMEPHRGHDPLLRSALVVDAALRRTAGRLAVLNLDPLPDADEVAAWRRWRDWLDAALDPARGPAPPTPRAVRRPASAESLRRLARQAELVFQAIKPEASDERA